MATSTTSISNMALTKLGEKTIESMDDDSPRARACNAVYEQCRDELLTEGPEKGWKFTLTRVGVAVSDDDPDFEYDYQYEIPNDCLRIVSVSADGVEYADWKREGDYILTNEVDDEIDLLYIKKITDTGKFPPHFAKALYTKMAITLCYRIKEASRHYERLMFEYEQRVLPKAIAMDEKEKYVEEEDDSWSTEGH